MNIDMYIFGVTLFFAIFGIALMIWGLYMKIEKNNKLITEKLGNLLEDSINKYIVSQEELQERIKTNNRIYVKRKKKAKMEDRAEKVIEVIMRELQEEGISSIVHTITNVSFYHRIDENISLRDEKYIYFSYDDLDVMHGVLFENRNKFENQYKIKIKHEDLVKYIILYFKDKDAIKETIKNKVKTDLGNELAEALKGEDNEKDSNKKKQTNSVLSGGMLHSSSIDDETRRRILTVLGRL